MGYTFVQLGSAVLAVSPPNLLCIPTSSLVGQCEKHSLDAV